jgi:putative restriction endonuclease
MPMFEPDTVRRLIGRRDMTKRLWDARTRGGAPHKPFLILALCDLFGSGSQCGPVIPGEGPVLISLAEHFASYWNRLIRDRRGDLMLPYWALSTSGFWTVVPRPGVTIASDGPKSFATFQKFYLGVSLSPTMLALLLDPVSREVMRSWIIATYFDEPTGEIIVGLVRYNAEANSFRLRLLEAAKDSSEQEAINRFSTELHLERPVRDQGFRIAVREAYDYRCAACGIRVLTPDGHVMVQGAHIRPHADTADDRIVNGLALCHTCHWSFDEGLWTVSATHAIRTSPVLRWGDNIANYLGNLEARQLLPASLPAFQPDPESLRWHRNTCFRAAL